MKGREEKIGEAVEQTLSGGGCCFGLASNYDRNAIYLGISTK